MKVCNTKTSDLAFPRKTYIAASKVGFEPKQDMNWCDVAQWNARKADQFLLSDAKPAVFVNKCKISGNRAVQIFLFGFLGLRQMNTLKIGAMAWMNKINKSQASPLPK